DRTAGRCGHHGGLDRSQPSGILPRSTSVTVKRTSSPPELSVRIDRRAPVPLRLQLERALRAAVQTGRLPAGSRLPSTRGLAMDLGVSRGLVVEAYDQLLAEGYLTVRHGSATRVAGRRASPTSHLPGEARPAPLRYDFR